MDRELRGVIMILVSGGFGAIMGIAFDKISLVLIGCTTIIFGGLAEISFSIRSIKRRAGEG